MNSNLTRFYRWESASSKEFDSAVSLHCHTHHSKEKIDFIPHYASRIPVVANFFHYEMKSYRKRNGKNLDFTIGYWTPPLSARGVYESELAQIESKTGLRPIVSITDHDDIQAGILMQTLRNDLQIPISCEWTVPYHKTVFHLGIHNLPSDCATQFMQRMEAYTKTPTIPELEEILTALDENAGCLTVLNHPLWDLNFIGVSNHKRELLEFLQKFGSRIHALEINGYRLWHENRGTVELAHEKHFPVVTGGDRHGQSPNAVLNLTRTNNFSAFAKEVRSGQSHVMILTEYKEPMISRTMETVADVLRYYPDYPEEQRRWTGRVFGAGKDDIVRPLSYYWPEGGPAWIRASLAFLIFLGSPQLRTAFRLLQLGEGTAL